MTTHYKFIPDDLSMNHTKKKKWKLKKWEKVKGDLVLCSVGFHCSPTILSALSYVKTSTLAIVEVRGESLKDTDKSCHREMRLTKIYKIEHKTWVEFAVFAAEKVIGHYEKQCPNDKRPRQAIEAAKKFIEDPSEENRAAANAAANAAYAAYSEANAANAANAAANAAYAAYSAANAANAAYAAANAAYAANAANAAANAAYAANAAANAANAEFKQELEAWLQRKIMRRVA